MGKMKKLTTLLMRKTNIQEIPPDLELCENLTKISAENSSLTSFPEITKNNLKMKLVSVSNTNVQLPAIERITRFRKMEDLSLEGLSLEKLPPDFALLSSLRFLSLNNNKFK